MTSADPHRFSRPLRLRTGRRNPHTLYAVRETGREDPAGFALTGELAESIAEVVNAHADHLDRIARDT
jgi:hypothetical protein